MKKINNILIIMMLIFSSFLIINNIKDNSVTADIILGNSYFNDDYSFIIATGLGDYSKDLVFGLQVIIPYDCYINSITARLISDNYKGDAICGIYDDEFNFVEHTEIIYGITDIPPVNYVFNFDNPVYFNENDIIYLVVYGTVSIPNVGNEYIYGISNYNSKDGSIYIMYEYQNNFPIFEETWSPTISSDSYAITLYANFKPYIPSCNSTALTVYNNTQHTTGKYETSYSSVIGWKTWLNYTSTIPSLTKYYNLKNTTGTLQNNFNSGSWNFNIWANYTGYSLILTILENLKNCTGAEQYYYNNITGWKVYNNFTGFSILLNAIENLINCTGTHASYYNSATGWKMYLNYTGNGSGGGSPVNRTINITLNGHGFFNSWNGSINTNVQNISILMNSDKSIVGNFSDNDSFYDDKYFLSGVLSIESGLLFLGICLSLWIFFISKYLEYRDMTISYIQFGLSIPTCLIVGVFSLSYPFGFVIVFLIPILSLSLIADSYFYRKKLKKK